MDTQPTQHGLMQIFTRLGLAANSPLTDLKALGTTDTGFADVLSGYLPNDAEQSATLMDESLPLLGQTLPLAPAPATGSFNLLSADEVPLLPLQVSMPSELVGLQHNNDKLEEPLIENELAEKDASMLLLEDQGFYAQSLVSGLLGSSMNNDLAYTDAAATAEKSLPFVAPQNIGNTASNHQRSPTTTLTASELDEISEQSPDRFLGSEPESSALRLRKTVPLELVPTTQTTTPVTNSATLEATISLALARNEDPISQSLNELIDGETLEKSELEAKLTTLEKKQDDQTLKLNKGQQAWGDTLMERITMNVAKDIKQVTIHLDPPELGSLELKMQVKEDQQTQVHVHVQNPQVKEALESSAQRLRDMLANQGLELAEFDVQADTGRGDQFAGSDDPQHHNQGESQDSDTLQNVTEEMQVEIPKAKNNNILDTFV